MAAIIWGHVEKANELSTWIFQTSVLIYKDTAFAFYIFMLPQDTSHVEVLCK